MVIANGAPPARSRPALQRAAVGYRIATLTLVTDHPFNLKVDYDLIVVARPVAAACFSPPTQAGAG